MNGKYEHNWFPLRTREMSHTTCVQHIFQLTNLISCYLYVVNVYFALVIVSARFVSLDDLCVYRAVSTSRCWLCGCGDRYVMDNRFTGHGADLWGRGRTVKSTVPRFPNNTMLKGTCEGFFFTISFYPKLYKSTIWRHPKTGHQFWNPLYRE